MDLLTRVKTLLGSKTQDNEGWIRQGKLAPAKNLQDVAAGVSKYFNPTSNNGNNFWSSNTAKGLANVQRAIPKPAQQFSQGFGNTTTYGLVDFKPQDKPTTAYRAGQVAGFLNPLNPLNKGMAALNVGGRVLSRVAPKIVGTTAGKIAGGVLSEAAQTGVYTAAQLAAQKAGLQEKRPINVAQNLATGIGLRGAFNQAPNVLRAMIRNKRLPDIDPADRKVMEEFINYARLGKKPSLKLEEYASTIAEQYNLPMPKTKAGLANVFDDYLSRFRQQQQEFESLGLPQMGIADNKGKIPVSTKGVGGEGVTPKTVRVWNKSKFSNDGAYTEIPVIRKEENITLYQGSKPGENRQFWTSDKKYAEQFGEAREKTGTFYKVDNGNRVTDVYVEAPVSPPKGVGTKTVRVSAPLKTQPSSTPQGQPIKIKQTPTLKVSKTAPPSNASSSPDILPQRGFVTTVKEAKQTVRPVKEGIEGTYTPITNKETLTTAQKAVADNYDVAKARVTNEPLSAETNTIAQELMRRAQKEGRYDEAIDIAETIAKKGTEAGQAVQAFSIWQRLTPEGMLKYATREIQKANENAGFLTKVFRKGEAKLSKEGAEFITTQMKKVQTLPEGVERDALIKSVMERINKEIPIGASELFDAYRYQNLLSSPRTQLRNAYQNAYQALINRPLTMATEAGVDWVQSTLKGKERTKYLSEVPQYYKGLWNSRIEAVNGFMSVWKGKADFTNPDIDQLRNKNLPKGLTVVSRLMEGADKYFQTLIGGGQYAALKKRGLSDELAKKGAEEMAQYSLLRNLPDPKNKSGQGVLLSAIDNATLGVTELGRRLPALRWFVPFIRTPMNAAKQWIEYSPAGVLTMAGNKDKSSQLAKSLIGTAVVGFGANLALQDRTTWSAPTDAKEKELFYASGKKPYSVLIGDKWVPMVYLGPQSLALAIPAAFKQYQQDSRTALTDSQIEKATKSLTSLMGFFSEQTFLSGLGSFVRAVSGDADYTYAGNISGAIGQIIPLSSLTRYVAQIIDPVFRKTGGSTVTEQITNQLKSQIPFATKTLEPYVTPTGELSKRNITDYMAPYSLGTEQPQYDQLLEERRDKLQQNAVLNKAKKDLKDGSQVVGNTVIYKENGETKSFTINSRPQFPTLTGQPELDKKLKSKYNSQLTAYKNDILKLYELGKISAKEAEELIGTVTTKKSGSGGSKKKVSFKVAKSSTVKITKSKAPNFGSLKTSSIKVVKRPNLKFSTPKKVVVAPPKSSKTIKIKALPTLKVVKGGSLT